MQIHEITRRSTNESILKGVANKAPALAPAAAPAAKPTTMQNASNVLKTGAKAVGGGMLNAAELASKMALDKLGVPGWAQGGSWQGGHVAALQRQSTAHINSQEERVAKEIADNLHKKWQAQGGTGDIPLVDNDITAQATEIHNASRSSKLPLDTAKVVASVKKRVADTLAAEKADAAERARKIIEIENEIVRIKREIDQGGLSQEVVAQKTQDVKTRMGVLKSIGGVAALDNLASKMTTTGNTTAAPAPAPAVGRRSKAPLTNKTRANKPGLPSSNDLANYEKQVKQAMAAQGQTP